MSECNLVQRVSVIRRRVDCYHLPVETLLGLIPENHQRDRQKDAARGFCEFGVGVDAVEAGTAVLITSFKEMFECTEPT